MKPNDLVIAIKPYTLTVMSESWRVDVTIGQGAILRVANVSENGDKVSVLVRDAHTLSPDVEFWIPVTSVAPVDDHGEPI